MFGYRHGGGREVLDQGDPAHKIQHRSMEAAAEDDLVIGCW